MATVLVPEWNTHLIACVGDHGTSEARLASKCLHRFAGPALDCDACRLVLRGTRHRPGSKRNAAASALMTKTDSSAVNAHWTYLGLGCSRDDAR